MNNLRKSFDKLLNEMDLFDLYQADDQVGLAINQLRDSIDEVEKMVAIEGGSMPSDDENNEPDIITQIKAIIDRWGSYNAMRYDLEPPVLYCDPASENVVVQATESYVVVDESEYGQLINTQNRGYSSLSLAELQIVFKTLTAYDKLMFENFNKK